MVKFPGDAGNYVGHLLAYGIASGCLVVLAKLRSWVAATALFAFGVVIEFVHRTWDVRLILRTRSRIPQGS